jgi:hypothetical protein
MDVSKRVIGFEVLEGDEASRERKSSICEQILSGLNVDFSSFTSTVICLIDNQENATLRLARGPANRGIFFPVTNEHVRDLIPDYFRNSILHLDCSTLSLERLYDCVIYMHGSTAASEIGLTLTLAHELQHFIQYATNRSTWATDKLLQKLRMTHEEEFRQWADFPIEREARVVSKRVAIEMHGHLAVEDFIRQERAKHITDADVLDCDFLLSSEADVAYSATQATSALVERFRPELIALQAQNSSDCPEVESLNLTSHIRG